MCGFIKSKGNTNSINYCFQQVEEFKQIEQKLFAIEKTKKHAQDNWTIVCMCFYVK